MNTELEDRLKGLGAHLDAERAVHATHPTTPSTNVVSLDARRRSSTLLAVAAAVVIAVGVAAIALNRGGSPEPTVPVTEPTTPTPTTVAPTGVTGTLTIEYQVEEGDPNDAVDRLTDRAVAIGLDADVNIDGRTITVVLHDVTDTDEGGVLRALNSVTDPVQLRPVTAACAADDGGTITPSNPAATQLLPVLNAFQRCEVGPALGTGAAFERDAAVQPIDASTPAVVVSLRPGADGTDVWNALAGHCYDKDTTCPTGQLAIELGGWLYSAPAVQTPVFEGNVQITGAWTDLDAKVLTDALNHDDPTFRLTTGDYQFAAHA